MTMLHPIGQHARKRLRHKRYDVIGKESTQSELYSIGRSQQIHAANTEAVDQEMLHATNPQEYLFLVHNGAKIPKIYH